MHSNRCIAFFDIPAPTSEKPKKKMHNTIVVSFLRKILRHRFSSLLVGGASVYINSQMVFKETVLRICDNSCMYH